MRWIRRTTLAMCTAVAVLAGAGPAGAQPDDYTLTVVMIGRDGAPATDNNLFLANYDDATTKRFAEPSGTVQVQLPRGDYFVQSAVHTGERRDRLTRPWLHLTGDTTVVFDARTTTPVDVTVERPDARLVSGIISASVLAGNRPVAVPFVGFDDFANVGTAQVGPDAPANRYVGSAQFTLAAPGVDGTFTDSPYSYSLAWFTPGKAYTGRRHVRDAELATVRTTNQPQGIEGSGGKMAIAAYTGLPNVSTYASYVPIRLPGVRTELFTTKDITWQLELSPQTEPSPQPPQWLQTVLARTYRAGHRYREVWNAGGVFGPALPGPGSSATWAVAHPDALSFRVPFHSAAADVWGSSQVDNAHTEVHHNGKQICESGEPAQCFIEGAPAPGEYRVVTAATRGFTDLSTKISSEWTFRHDGPAAPNLPVQVVRFDPGLDETNSAPGGRPHHVTVTVHRNPGAAKAGVRSLTVDVSYDDGVTWQRTPVTMVGDRGIVVLRHPTTGYVSMRAKAVDTAGNSVDQTIVHAYRLR